MIAILFLVSISGFAQTKDFAKYAQTAGPGKIVSDSIQYRDSFPPIPDSIQFMSTKQMENVYKLLEDNLKVTDYKRISEGLNIAFQVLIQSATEEYNKKNKGRAIKIPVKK